MDGYEQERRGLFDGLTVPHSLNAILIAALGLLVYWGGIRAIEGLGVPGEGSCRSIAGMLGNITMRLGTFGKILAYTGGWENKITHFSGLVWIAFWGWTFAVWALFSGAVNRIAAMKLAREESLELKDALGFGFQKFFPNLLSIVFVFVLVAIFYLLFNGTVAGFIGRIPAVGGYVLGILFFLVLLSSFMAVFVAVLGLLGFNLSSSAIATEASDTFDGVSRAWNYILARPWTMILTTCASIVYLTLVIFFGHWFLKVSVKSLAVGSYGLGATPRAVEVDPELAERLELPKVRSVVLPGKADYLYQRLIGKAYRPDKKGRILYRQGFAYALEEYRGHMGRYPARLEDLVMKPEGAKVPEGFKGWSGPYMSRLPQDRWGQAFVYEVSEPKKRDGYKLSSKGKDGVAGTADDQSLMDIEEQVGPLGPPIDIAPFIESNLAFSVGALGFWLGIARLLLYGYVVAYFLSSQTMIYFLLRKDVEGDDYREITLEDEFEDEGAWEHVAPPKDGPAEKPEQKAEEPKPEASEETPDEGGDDEESKPEA